MNTVTSGYGRGSPSLNALFNPRSVAVVGASGDPNRIGGRPIAYMKALEFPGEIYPVNPGRTEVQGLRAYPSLTSIGQSVDLVVIATPADTVQACVEEAIAIGAGAAVVFTSGFSEKDAEGARAQTHLSNTARAGNLTLVGPNCLGLIDTHSRLVASFTTALEDSRIASGEFAFISQSGALAAYWLDMVRQADIGVSRWLTTGNEGGVTIADALEYLAEDDSTRVIGMYVEDIKDGRRFREAALAARRAGKPIIAIKAGRSAAGARAAASHTGALTGEHASYEAFFRQFGIVSVRSLTEMMHVARLCLQHAIPEGDRLGVLSVSGGAGVMLADAADLAGFSVAPLAEETREALREVLPSYATPQNPVDLTGTVVQQREIFQQALGIVARASELDAVVLFIGLMHSIADELAEILSKTFSDTSKPVIVTWLGAPDTAKRQLEEAGIVVFPDIPETIAAMAAARIPARFTFSGKPLPEATPAATTETEPVPEHQAKQIIRRSNSVRVPEGRLIRSMDDISDLDQGPYVAKLQSADLMHKSDHDAVRLGLDDEHHVRQAVADLLEIGRKLHIPVDGVLVECMVPFSLELVIGLRRDPVFGPMLMVGRGGVAVELEPDTAIGFLPMDAKEIEALLRSLRCHPLFDGFRGQPPVDITTAAEAIGKLANDFLTDSELVELEINPLVLSVSGSDTPSGVWALDAIAWVRKS